LLVFEAGQVVERFEKMGDLHAAVLELKQKLPDLRAAASVPQPAMVDPAEQAEEEEPLRPAAKKSSRTKKKSSAPGKTSSKAAAKKRRAV